MIKLLITKSTNSKWNIIEHKILSKNNVVNFFKILLELTNASLKRVNKNQYVVGDFTITKV